MLFRLRAVHSPPVSLPLIGKLFRVTRGTIRNHAEKYSADLNRSALPQDEIDQTVETILRFFEERTSLTLAEIHSTITYNSSE
jgi:hypothetical protein